MTRHTVRVTFHRDDREEPVQAGTHTFTGQDYEAFDEEAARKALVEEGQLVIGPDIITFGGTMAPTAKVDHIRVEIVSKTKG